MPSEGKSDMERLGIFQEMSYISIGDKYISPSSKPFNEAASKNRQMLPGGSKSMANTLGGYFDAEFKRIFAAEAYLDPLKQRRQHRMQQAKKNLGKAFLPSNGEKLPSGVGSFYGTLGGPVPSFSAGIKARKAYTAPGKNIYTNPPKQGTGYGYPNLTIGKQYSYAPDNYDRTRDLTKKEFESHKLKLKGGAFRLNLYPKDYFDTNPFLSNKPLPPLKKKAEKKQVVKPFKPSSPAKEPGGMKAGTFDTYPSHSNDVYGKRLTKSATVVKGGKAFQPPTGPKSFPIKSILSSHVAKSVNPANYKSVNLTPY